MDHFFLLQTWIIGEEFTESGATSYGKPVQELGGS